MSASAFSRLSPSRRSSPRRRPRLVSRCALRRSRCASGRRGRSGERARAAPEPFRCPAGRPRGLLCLVARPRTVRGPVSVGWSLRYGVLIVALTGPRKRPRPSGGSAGSSRTESSGQPGGALLVADYLERDPSTGSGARRRSDFARIPRPRDLWRPRTARCSSPRAGASTSPTRARRSARWRAGGEPREGVAPAPSGGLYVVEGQSQIVCIAPGGSRAVLADGLNGVTGSCPLLTAWSSSSRTREGSGS